MSHRSVLPLLSIAFLFAAEGAHSQAATEKAKQVNVYQYAVDNPVDNAQMRLPPTLGASVPKTVNLVPLDKNDTYAYFYYNGFPVIVDLSTRSVVRIGK